jgi:hypothetical protein
MAVCGAAYDPVARRTDLANRLAEIRDDDEATSEVAPGEGSVRDRPQAPREEPGATPPENA